MEGVVVWLGKVRLGESYLQFEVTEFLSTAIMLTYFPRDR